APHAELVFGQPDGSSWLRCFVALWPRFHSQRASPEERFVGGLYDGLYSFRKRHRLADEGVGTLFPENLRAVGGGNCSSPGSSGFPRTVLMTVGPTPLLPVGRSTRFADDQLSFKDEFTPWLLVLYVPHQPIHSHLRESRARNVHTSERRAQVLAQITI